MSVLLDTNALIWLLERSPRLGPGAVRQIDRRVHLRELGEHAVEPGVQAGIEEPDEQLAREHVTRRSRLAVIEQTRAELLKQPDVVFRKFERWHGSGGYARISTRQQSGSPAETLT